MKRRAHDEHRRVKRETREKRVIWIKALIERSIMNPAYACARVTEWLRLPDTSRVRLVVGRASRAMPRPTTATFCNRANRVIMSADLARVPGFGDNPYCERARGDDMIKFVLPADAHEKWPVAAGECAISECDLGAFNPIFEFLPLLDLISCARTCAKWRRLVMASNCISTLVPEKYRKWRGYSLLRIATLFTPWRMYPQHIPNMSLYPLRNGFYTRVTNDHDAILDAVRRWLLYLANAIPYDGRPDKMMGAGPPYYYIESVRIITARPCYFFTVCLAQTAQGAQLKIIKVKLRVLRAKWVNLDRGALSINGFPSNVRSFLGRLSRSSQGGGGIYM